MKLKIKQNKEYLLFYFVFTKNGSQVNLLFLDAPHPIHLNVKAQKTSYWVIVKTNFFYVHHFKRHIHGYNYFQACYHYNETMLVKSKIS